MSGCNMHRMFRHRLSALCVASLSTLAMSLAIAAGLSNQFIRVKHEDSHSPMAQTIIISDEVTPIDQDDNSHSHLIEDNHQIGLFSSSTFHSFKIDTTWRIAQGFYVFSCTLQCMLVIFAWAISFFIRPTHSRWRSLSISSIAIAGFQVPVFLVFEAKFCTSIDGQKCSLGDGFFMMLWSVILLVLVMALTQWWPCPEWWDALTEWKVESLQNESTFENELELRDTQDEGFGFVPQPQTFGTATNFERWCTGVKRKINFYFFGRRLGHSLVNNESYFDDIASSDIENGEENSGSDYLSSPTIDNSRLLLCVTKDGKQVGDDRESQHSYEIQIEDHFHLSEVNSCGSSSSSYNSNDLDFHSIRDVQSRSHDGIPAQFSPARRAAAMGQISHISESRRNRSLSPFPVQELNENKKNSQKGGLPLQQLQPRDTSEKRNISEQDKASSDLGDACLPLHEQNIDYRLDEKSSDSGHNSIKSISSYLDGEMDDHCEPDSPPSIIKEVENHLYLNSKQIDKTGDRDQEIDENSEFLDFMSTCSAETEGKTSSKSSDVHSKNSSSGSDTEDTSIITTKLASKIVDGSSKVTEEAISLDEAIVAGANAAEESNNSISSDIESESQLVSDLEPASQYYSSDESTTSSLSLSTFQSLSTCQNSQVSDSLLSNTECDNYYETESKQPIVYNLSQSSPMGLQHNRRRSKKGMKSSASSVCSSKRSLLEYTIDEETDLDIEREKDSDEETNNFRPENMVVGGSPFKVQNAAVISPMRPMRVSLGPSSQTFSNQSYNLRKNCTEDAQTESYDVSQALNSSYEKKSGNDNNIDNGSHAVISRISRRKKRRAKMEASSQQETKALPVVSPTNDSKGDNMDADGMSVESIDYPIISIPMKSAKKQNLRYTKGNNNSIAYDSSSDDDLSCLSGSISGKARSARRKRLQHESRTRYKFDTTVGKETGIITATAIVQDYGSDEASF